MEKYIQTGFLVRELRATCHGVSHCWLTIVCTVMVATECKKTAGPVLSRCIARGHTTAK